MKQRASLKRLVCLSGHLKNKKEVKLIRELTSAATKKHYKYLIVGGGNASGYAVKEFVDQNAVAPGNIGVLTEESVCPYERPALTKAYLHPPHAKVRARLPGFHTCVGGGGERQDREWYSKRGVDMKTGVVVTKIDNKQKLVQTEDGTHITYENLLFATGARAISLAEIGVKGGDLDNVFTIRNEEDASKLVKALEKERGDAIIIGGGYIGMESAAAISGWGNNVTMVFPEDQLMQRLFPKEVADWFENQFNSRGIHVIKGTTVKELLGENGKIKAAKLSNGKTLDASIVIAGIGAKPNTQLLRDQVEFSKDGGLIVNGQFCTSDPFIRAFGDVAAFPAKHVKDGIARFEHVSNCRQSASHMVKCLLGKTDEPYTYLPYFYSRLFEYTDSPLVFQFYGHQLDSEGNPLQIEAFAKPDLACAVWFDGNRTIHGALIVNGSNESYEKAKSLALENPTLESSAYSLFS